MTKRHHLSVPKDALLSLINEKQYTLYELSECDVDELCWIENTLNPSPWSNDNFLSSMSRAHLCYGFRIQDQCVAYAVCSHVLDEVELLLIGVRKECQGRGLAKALLQVLINKVESNARSVFLEVRASNNVAIALYESVGFNCVGERPAYYPAIKKAGQERYQQREDALIFALEFFQ